MSHTTRIALFSALALAATARAQLASAGLSAVRSQRFDNEDLLFNVPEHNDHFGSAFAVGDFNGDGVDDLATGIPEDDGDVGSGCTDCGAVVVRYGIAGAGLATGFAFTLLSDQYGAAPSPAIPGERFGAALAAGDFNGDGIDDLAIGIPGDDPFFPGGATGYGAVEIHYGHFGGIEQDGSHYLNPDVQDIPYGLCNTQQFGYSLAAGDFDADSYDDLAIGAPFLFCGVSGGVRAGAVVIAQGHQGGLLPFFGGGIDQAQQDVPETPEAGDRFGLSLASGDLNGDGYDDLAIGVPGEDGVGAVLTVYGSQFSLLLQENQWFGQGDIGLGTETGEDEDFFGAALAAGDFDGDGRDDLAIGVPGEDLPGAADTGLVNVIYGTSSPAFDFGRTQIFGQADFGEPGFNETGDALGFALAAADFDRDGRDDLAIAHYLEDSGAGVDSGAVTIVMGRTFGLCCGDRTFTEGVNGIPGGSPQNGRYFGYAMAAGDFDNNGHADLVIGAPREDAGNLANPGAEVVLYGSLYSDGFESGNSAYWSLRVP